MCGKSDRSAKVSVIYLAGVEERYRNRRNKKLIEKSDVTEAQDFSKWDGLADGRLVELVSYLSPPRGKRPPLVRPLNPDLMVGALTLVAPVFIYGMSTSQPKMLWFAGALLLVFYMWYFWKRKALLDKYRVAIEQQKTADTKLREETERWMKLYFCARDNVTFTKAGKEVTFLDESYE